MRARFGCKHSTTATTLSYEARRKRATQQHHYSVAVHMWVCLAIETQREHNFQVITHAFAEGLKPLSKASWTIQQSRHDIEPEI